ncbi:hypothetical protein RB195_011516 [Necator americanus]|uniref:Uncharacterized protein n=1 Tax=Necator americanus TaxID=51031 RepID=A0ABR1D2R2_NECAM
MYKILGRIIQKNSYAYLMTWIEEQLLRFEHQSDILHRSKWKPGDNGPWQNPFCSTLPSMTSCEEQLSSVLLNALSLDPLVDL